MIYFCSAHFILNVLSIFVYCCCEVWLKIMQLYSVFLGLSRLSLPPFFWLLLSVCLGVVFGHSYLGISEFHDFRCSLPSQDLGCHQTLFIWVNFKLLAFPTSKNFLRKCAGSHEISPFTLSSLCLQNSMPSLCVYLPSTCQVSPIICLSYQYSPVVLQDFLKLLFSNLSPESQDSIRSHWSLGNSFAGVPLPGVLYSLLLLVDCVFQKVSVLLYSQTISGEDMGTLD